MRRCCQRRRSSRYCSSLTPTFSPQGSGALHALQDGRCNSVGNRGILACRSWRHRRHGPLNGYPRADLRSRRYRRDLNASSGLRHCRSQVVGTHFHTPRRPQTGVAEKCGYLIPARALTTKLRQEGQIVHDYPVQRNGTQRPVSGRHKQLRQLTHCHDTRHAKMLTESHLPSNRPHKGNFEILRKISNYFIHTCAPVDAGGFPS